MKQNLLNALRKGTNVAIKIDSHSIALVPHQRTRKPGGVYDNEPQPARPVQQFMIQHAGAGSGLRPVEGAQIHKWDYEIVGAHNSVMEIGDTWEDNGTQYRIISILPDNGYERRGAVSAIGKEPSYGS